MDKKDIKKDINKLYQENNISRLYKPEKSNNKKIIIIVLAMAIVFGLIAGMFGGFFILVTRKIKTPFGKEYNLDQYLPKREITIETMKNVTVTPDIQTSDIIKGVQPQIVDIFLKKGASEDVLEQIYRKDEILGKGFILTSDGWIITTNDVINPKGKADKNIKKNKEYIILTSDGSLYPVQKILFDPLTKIAFLKVIANDLSVAKLAEKEDIMVGQEMLVFSNKGVFKSEINKLNYHEIKQKEDLLESIENFSSFILLRNNSDNSSISSPVFNLSGAVVGLTTAGQKVIPIFSLRNLITQVLKDGERLVSGSYLQRPYLGVDYLDLSVSRGISSSRFKDLTAGALIYGTLDKTTPAYIAGLRNADVILKVNNDLVDGKNNLGWLIWQYEPESTLELTILRSGKEIKLQTILAKTNVK